MSDTDFTTPPMLRPVGPITREHHKWLDSDSEEYSPTALRFVRKALGGGYKHRRDGRISISGLGQCERRQMFQFHGAPKNPAADNKGMTLMKMGVWGHLRWQAEGLTMGWLKRAEVWVQTRVRASRATKSLADLVPVGGSIDGVTPDGRGFELKTTNYRTFDKIRSTGEVPHNNLLQVQAYMMLTSIEEFSVMYETREWGDFHEVIVEQDDEIQEETRTIVQRLRHHATNGTLPPILEECQWREGFVYKSCPFRGICLELDPPHEYRGTAAL